MIRKVNKYPFSYGTVFLKLIQKLCKHPRWKTCRHCHPPRSSTRKYFWTRCGKRWGWCHFQSKPCVQEVEGYCCKRHFPQKRTLLTAVKIVQLGKASSDFRKEYFAMYSIQECLGCDRLYKDMSGFRGSGPGGGGGWYCHKCATVEPRFNEPLYNEVLDITNDFLQPGQNYSKMYGTKPRYNEPRYNEILFITNRIQKPKRGKHLDITNKCQFETKDECETDQQVWHFLYPVSRGQQPITAVYIISYRHKSI